MQPAQVSVTGVGTSAWIPMDVHRCPFNVGFGAVATGTVTYTIQHTFVPDLLVDAVVPAAQVFPHETVAAVTVSADGNYAFPVTGIRVEITAGTGTVDLTVIQAGIRTG